MTRGPKELAQSAMGSRLFSRVTKKAVTENTSISRIEKIATLQKLVNDHNRGVLKRGRPKKANALTPAEKQKAYRERKAKRA